MEKELAPDVIKATQVSLGKYVKRPPLSEKLLRKPPFRFLHDIVLSVHKTTGFFDGLFEENELISENVKDRESKMLFLNKVISVIGTTTGKSLTVKSSKIVAGQEPEKTNELLQCLAFALDNKLSSSEAVKKYKEDVKIPISTEVRAKEKETNKITKKSTNDTKKVTPKNNEKLSNKKQTSVDKNDSNINNESKPNRKDSIVKKNETLSKKSQQSKNKNTSETNKIQKTADEKSDAKIIGGKDNIEDNSNEKEDKKTENIPHKLEKSEEESKEDFLNTSVKDSSMNASVSEILGKSNSSYTIAEKDPLTTSQDLIENETGGNNEKPTEKSEENNVDTDHHDSKVLRFETESINLSAKRTELPLPREESIDSIDKGNSEKNQINDKSASVSSSRKNSDVIRPLSVRPSSSRPGAPRLREKIDNLISDSDNNLLLAKVNIIAESSHNEDEEDASVVVVEHQTSDESATVNQENQLQLSSNEHGHLVQQILDSQKEFSKVGKTEIEWQFGVQKVKEAVNQEIEQLRFNIQALSRVANPLGKLLDHIQEDAEVMRQELQQWNNTYEEVSKEKQKQKIANEETLVPLQTRMKHLDVEIQEKHDKIVDLKILIHKNALRIEQLLKNGNVQ